MSTEGRQDGPLGQKHARFRHWNFFTSTFSSCSCIAFFKIIMKEMLWEWYFFSNIGTNKIARYSTKRRLANGIWCGTGDHGEQTNLELFSQVQKCKLFPRRGRFIVILLGSEQATLAIAKYITPYFMFSWHVTTKSEAKKAKVNADLLLSACYHIGMGTTYLPTTPQQKNRM